jgi:integrase
MTAVFAETILLQRTIGAALETMQVRTVRDALERHIDLRTAVGDYTLKRYRTSLDNYFAGPFGATDIADLDFETCAEWVRAVQEREPRPAAKTVRNQFGLLSSALKTSGRLGLRANNPCEGIRLPASQSTESLVRVLTRKEWAGIKAHLEEPYLLFFSFLLETGMRFGEATALTSTDFDYDNSPVLVSVSKAWKENAHGRHVVGPPKTATSRRRISLSAKLPRTAATRRGGGL